jgi:hypothetical protein
MRRLPITISLFTVLFFIFSLTGNVLIADPAFSNVAYAKKGDDKDKDKDKGKKGIPKKIAALQAEIDALEQELTNIELTPGPQGEQGMQGETGTTGTTGPQGDTGFTGSTGAQGPKGDTGLQGKQGVAGNNGAEGAQGPQGLTGNTGEAGQEGPIGLKGADGTNGIDGAQGPVGPIGATGSQGDQGPKGDIGLTGAKGDTGSTGGVGPIGPEGSKGDTGNTGPQGLSGDQLMRKSNIYERIVGVHVNDSGVPLGADYSVTVYCDDNSDILLSGGHTSNAISNDMRTRYSYPLNTANTGARAGYTWRGKCNFTGCIMYAVASCLSVPSTPNPKTVFVTSQTFNGNLGGVSGAHNKCQTLADASTLAPPGTYKAWISDIGGSSPSNMFTRNADFYKTVDGKIVANGWEKLTELDYNGGNLLNPINITENGEEVMVTNDNFHKVWTATAADGTLVNNGFQNTAADVRTCEEWTSSSSEIRTIMGEVQRLNYQWTDINAVKCSNQSRLYCFQQ